MAHQNSARTTRWGLVSFASGQITMRKVDGWQRLGQPPTERAIDLAA